jgi:hypothetical protein
VFQNDKVTILDRQRQSSPESREPLPGEDEWYVLIKEKEYGPLRLGQLAQLARQRRLQKSNWVWKPGLESWIAAGEVSGLFTESVQFLQEPAQLDRSVGEEGGTQNKKHNLKERAKDQIRNFALMFLYLWVVFGMLAIHESMVLSQHQINYQSHGLAVINALIFAKDMLVAEDLHLGNRLNDRPLIYSILFKSLLFGVTLICFHILEHVAIGMWDGKTIAESISEIGANKLGGMVSVGIISTVALVPFFILREIGRVIGEDKVWSLFFRRRNA